MFFSKTYTKVDGKLHKLLKKMIIGARLSINERRL